MSHIKRDLIFILILMRLALLLSSEGFRPVPGLYELPEQPYLSEAFLCVENDPYWEEKKRNKLIDSFNNWFWEQSLETASRLNELVLEYGLDYQNFFISNQIAKEEGSEEEATDYSNLLYEVFSGFKGGWYINWRLAGRLSLQPELNYKYKRSSLDIKDFSFNVSDIPQTENRLKMELDLQYAEIPLILQYRIKNRQEEVSFLCIGAVLNYLIKADLTWKYTASQKGDKSFYASSGSSNLGELNRILFALTGGLGYRSRIMNFSINFDYGLNQVLDSGHEYTSYESFEEVHEFLNSEGRYLERSISFQISIKL